MPRVASINLCADQHLLALADPEQILTVSWLAADPEESLLASEAQRHTLNYGTAEELLKFAPDVVLAGTYTSPFTRTMLRRLGYRVVELEPEESIADIERNVRLVAEVVGQVARGEQLVAALQRRRARDRSQAPRAPRAVRSSFDPAASRSAPTRSPTSCCASPACRNVAAEHGLDRWGSLSMEALLRSAPELIVLTGYRSSQPSLANAVLEHPALATLAAARTVTVPTALWACGLPDSIEAAALLQRAAPP